MVLYRKLKMYEIDVDIKLFDLDHIEDYEVIKAMILEAVQKDEFIYRWDYSNKPYNKQALE